MNNYFENVIGYDYVKKELYMILDVMKNQEKYKKLWCKNSKECIVTWCPWGWEDPIC